MLKIYWDKWRELTPTVKWICRVAAIMVAYTLIGFFLIPFVGQKVLQDQLPKVLKRPVSIESVHFNPYTLNFSVEGFKVAKKKGEGDLLAFKKIDLNVDSFSIFRLTLILTDVSFDNLYLDVSIYKGGSSVSDLIPKDDAKTQKKEQKADSGSLFPVIVENFSVTNSTIKVFDQPKNKHHVISDINIMIPFTSTLSSAVKHFVQPSLSAVINGTPFEMKGKTLPFDTSLRTKFNFVLQKVELKDYQAYLPLPKEVKIKSGTLSSTLSLIFDRGGDTLPKVRLSGDSEVENFSLTHTQQGQLIGFKDLKLKFDDFRFLKRIVHINSIKLLDPYVKLTLKKDGMPELLDFLTPVSNRSAAKEQVSATEAQANSTTPVSGLQNANATVATNTNATVAINANATVATVVGTNSTAENETVQPEESKQDNASEAPMFLATIDSFEMAGGIIDFKDNAFGKGFTKKIGPINVACQNITTARNKYGKFSIEIGKSGKEYIVSRGRVALTPLDVDGAFSVGNMTISGYQNYYEDFLPLDISSGSLNVDGAFRFMPPATGVNATTKISDLNVGLKKFRMDTAGKKSPVVGLDAFNLSNGTIDLGRQQVSVDSVKIKGGLVRLTRDKKGIDLVRLLDELKKKSAAKSQKSPDVPLKEANATTQSWKVQVNKIGMASSQFELIDRAATKKTIINLGDINLSVDDFSLDGAKSMLIDLSGKINDRGRFSVNGKARMKPLFAQGTVDLFKIRLRDFNGYLPPKMEMNIARGHLDVKGKWTFSDENKAVAGYKGKVQLKDLLVRDNSNNKSVFTLSELAVRDIDFKSKPLGATVGLVNVIKPGLNIVREQDGTINLARMLTGQRARPVNATAIEEQAESINVKSGASTMDQPASPGDINATVAEDSESGTNVSFMLEKVKLTNGTMIFSDQTVKPVFNMDISDMVADITKLGLPYGNRTDVVFNATVDNQSPLLLSGVLLPVGKTFKSGMKLTLSNLDMTQLSPYTLKYIAYPVSTGMLNADVDLNLDGSEIAVGNLFKLYQFDVGNKVPNPDAANVPIGLGLALLKDSAGNIQLDIPVEGNLSDPQFRLGAVIGRAIVNLLIKAVTSPFALIGSIFGGGEDINVLAFDPGTDILNESAMKKIATIAKAMKERPGLSLEISGFTASQLDRPALEKLIFNRKIAMAKYLEIEGDDGAPKSVDKVKVTAEEYPDYLEDVYKEEPFEKPRNLIGMVKTLPVPEMEKAIRDHIQVTPSDLSQLARKRAEVVRDILINQKGIKAERIFLKEAQQVKAKSAGPRVELGLK